MAEPSGAELGALSHLDALLATLGPVGGLRIIDIGCGDGQLTRALAKLGAQVTGYDPFIAGTELTRDGAGSYRLAKAAADAIPEPDHGADLVVFVFSLHHVPGAKLEGALAEARRLLRPTGRLYVAEPLAEGPHQYVIELFHDETAVRKEAAAALARFARPGFATAKTLTYLDRRNIPDFELLRRADDRQHAVQRLHPGSGPGAGGASPLRRGSGEEWRHLRPAGAHRLLRSPGLTNTRRKESMGKDRLAAFSDGVIAIIITIMVLELKVPPRADWTALAEIAPSLVGYVLSFIYLAIYWNNHHHLLHTVTRVDGLILWANSHLLFWLSLIPAATAWMGQNFLAPVPTAVYGIVLLMPAIAYFLLQRAIMRKQGAQSMLAKALGGDIKGKISIVFYLAGIAAAFVSPWAAVAIYVLVAVMWLIPDRRIESVLGRE